MDKHSAILAAITGKGLLPLYFNADETTSIEVLKALYNAGIRAVEYTNRGTEALANFKAMKKVCEASLPGMYLGIGTIKNTNDATAFIEAGADFLISPGLNTEIAKLAVKEQILFIPGCQTPSEIMLAEELGAKMIKLFPGTVLGPQFVAAVKEVFPGLVFMPTGGVDTSVENLTAWFAAGVSAVGMGSKLVSKKIMDEKEYDMVSKLTTEVLQRIEGIR